MCQVGCRVSLGVDGGVEEMQNKCKECRRGWLGAHSCVVMTLGSIGPAMMEWL